MPLHQTPDDTRLHLQRPLEDDMRQIDLGGKSHSDLRELYALSKKSRSGSARSLSSITSHRSTATCLASNTTSKKEQQKREKRKFRQFAKWLMKFLERKDPRVFGKAQHVIHDCEQRKKRGEAGYESVTDSLKEPLREVVGKRYWREARCQLDSALSSGDQSLYSLESLSSEPSEIEDEELPRAFSFPDPAVQSPYIRIPLNRPPPPPQMEVSPFAMTNAWNHREEKKIRRERFYMLLRVLMKYVESKDNALYLRAKAAMNDCVERKGKNEKGSGSLCESIKKAVKQVVGDNYWRRAESYLAKAILQQAVVYETEEARSRKEHEEEALMLIQQPLLDEFHQEPHHHQSGLDYSVAEEEEPRAEVHEFFVNVCHVFSSTTKRTNEEQAHAFTSRTSNFCLKHTEEEIESEAVCFESKRRRLQTAPTFAAVPSFVSGRPRF